MSVPPVRGAWARSLHQWLREPLVHFAGLGALLFAMYGVVSGDAPTTGPVVVDQARVEALATVFAKVQQRPPTPSEMRRMVDAWIRDEILYREGLATGLDRDDPVIRRRVVQKMTFMADSMVADTPSEAELQAWLGAHAERYRVEPSWSFRHVFFDGAGDRGGMPARLDRARVTLARQEPAGGDPTLLPPRLDRASASEVSALFGAQFVKGLRDLPVGAWHGPVSSAYGQHLVRIEAHEPGREATLDEVRVAVERDLLASRTDTLTRTFYDAIRQRYQVLVDLPGGLDGIASAGRASATGVGGAR